MPSLRKPLAAFLASVATVAGLMTSPVAALDLTQGDGHCTTTITQADVNSFQNYGRNLERDIRVALKRELPDVSGDVDDFIAVATGSVPDHDPGAGPAYDRVINEARRVGMTDRELLEITDAIHHAHLYGTSPISEYAYQVHYDHDDAAGEADTMEWYLLLLPDPHRWYGPEFDLSPKGTAILGVILPHYLAFYAGLADLYRSCAEGKTGSITVIQYGDTPGNGGGSSFGSS